MNNKYQNGKIYLIYSKDYPLIYYESTCKNLDGRMERHEQDFKSFSMVTMVTYLLLKSLP